MTRCRATSRTRSWLRAPKTGTGEPGSYGPIPADNLGHSRTKPLVLRYIRRAIILLMMRRVLEFRALGQAARGRLGRRGTTALEFALISIPVLTFMFLIFGIGIIGLYQQVLDNAVRDVTRQLQINAAAASGAGNFVNAICASLAVMTSPGDCTAAVSYSVQATSYKDTFAALVPAAVSNNGTLPNGFFSAGVPFGPGTNILVQVCWQLPFAIPFVSGLLTAGVNGRCLYGIGATRAEPYQAPI